MEILNLQSNDKGILDRFNNVSFSFARSGIIHESLSHFPRIFLETLGFGLIAIVVVYLVYKYQTDISSALGILSMFVLGLYRLIPSANRLLSSYNQIMYYHKSSNLYLFRFSDKFAKKVFTASFSGISNRFCPFVRLTERKNNKIAINCFIVIFLDCP